MTRPGVQNVCARKAPGSRLPDKRFLKHWLSPVNDFTQMLLMPCLTRSRRISIAVIRRVLMIWPRWGHLSAYCLSSLLHLYTPLHPLRSALLNLLSKPRLRPNIALAMLAILFVIPSLIISDLSTLTMCTKQYCTELLGARNACTRDKVSF